MTAITTSAALALALAMQGPSDNAANTEASASTEAATEVVQKPEKISDRSHPDYIRCKRERVIGSLAKYTKRCYTNREWEEIARAGNAGTRSIVEDHQTGMNASN